MVGGLFVAVEEDHRVASCSMPPDPRRSRSDGMPMSPPRFSYDRAMTGTCRSIASCLSDRVISLIRCVSLSMRVGVVSRWM